MATLNFKGSGKANLPRTWKNEKWSINSCSDPHGTLQRHGAWNLHVPVSLPRVLFREGWEETAPVGALSGDAPARGPELLKHSLRGSPPGKGSRAHTSVLLSTKRPPTGGQCLRSLMLILEVRGNFASYCVFHCQHQCLQGCATLLLRVCISTNPAPHAAGNRSLAFQKVILEFSTNGQNL